MYFNTGNDVSREECKNGFCLYAFDLSAEICGAGDHFNPIQRRNLALDIKFVNAPTHAVNLSCYGEFENLIQIDVERNVIYDYSG